MIIDLATHAVRKDPPLVSYRRVAPPGRSPAPPPAFIFGPSTPDLARALYGQIDTPELGCYAIADAIVAPTGIPICAGTAFSSQQLNLPAHHVAAVTARLASETLPIRHVPGPLAILLGPAEEDYATLITDYLPRLWLLQSAGYDLATLRFLAPVALPCHAENILAHLGLAPDQLIRYAHWKEILHTDLLLLPTISRLTGRLSPHFVQATRFWTARIGAAFALPPPDPQDRLYIATTNGPENRALLEAIAANQGFRIITPETMDLPTRIAVFSHASHIVGPYGPALHDAVFSTPATRICALCPTSNPGFLLGGLASQIGYVFAATGTFTLDEADYRRGLEILTLA